MKKLQSKFSQDGLPRDLGQWEFQWAANKGENFNSRLHRKYLFVNFESAIDFIQQASKRFITSQNHHPCWQNSYATLDIWLTTHEAENSVTTKDVDLAQCLEMLWLEEYCKHQF